MTNVLQVIAGLAIVFIVPGYALVNMLFPRRGELDPDLDIVYRITIGIGTSIVISMLVGFALNSISDEEHGYVSAGPLWASLLSLTGIFLLGGWYRGAYPRLGLLHPSLYRAPGTKGAPGAGSTSYARQKQVDKLVKEREMLLADLKSFSERSTTSNPKRQLYYRRRTENATERIAKINEELGKLESGMS